MVLRGRFSIDEDTTSIGTDNLLYASDSVKELHESDIVSSNNTDHSNHYFGLTTVCSRASLSRVSTILEAIRDENKLTRKESANNMNLQVPHNEFKPTDDNDDNDDNVAKRNPEKSQLEFQVESDNLERQKAIDLQDDGTFNRLDLEDMPPDGTFWGWTAAFCVLSINCFSWGLNSAYGVFLDYYVESNHFPEANMEEYALIGGLGLGVSFMLMNLPNIFVKVYGMKPVMFAGIVLQFLCLWLASIAVNITQLIIFQGIVFARPCQAIIQSPGGYKWALRFEACLSGFMLCISTLFLRSRRPLKSPTKVSLWKEIKDQVTRFDVYRQRPMLCIAVWKFIYGFAYAILLFSFSSYGTSIGLTRKQGSTVTTVQSVAQCIGRPILGYVSDKMGRTNATIVFTFFIALICLVYWTFITTYSQLMGFGFIAGFTMGINWVNFTPLIADVLGGGPELVAGVAFVTVTGGIPFIPAEIIALKLKKTGSVDKPFLWCQVFVALCCIVSACVLLPFREWKISRMFTGRRRILQTKLDNGKEPLTEIELKRLDRYNRLLEPSWGNYVIRMLYPIKA
ncbi:unnamed protein product [Ambrosiozyma monospora]|uniref:Unnamed protein product n=1 Tax=Ambrosiozyma monospora TaxID=43982 RepID=A0ACB5SRY1_AMBMO|nr:unnamed protein product [Ambrosiozyma monospora]